MHVVILRFRILTIHSMTQPHLFFSVFVITERFCTLLPFHFALFALLHIFRTEFGVSTKQPDLLSWLQFATAITQSFSVRYTPLARRLQLLLLQQICRWIAVGSVGCIFVRKFNIFKSWQNHSISVL